MCEEKIEKFGQYQTKKEALRGERWREDHIGDTGTQKPKTGPEFRQRTESESLTFMFMIIKNNHVTL